MKKIQKYLHGWIEWFKGSADNDPGGASSKKLTGFYCFVLVGIVVSAWCIHAFRTSDWAMLPYVITTIGSFGLVALGINSNEKIKMNDQKPKE